MSSLKDASIMLWNAQSVRPKLTELTNFLHTQKVDICLIPETWLKHGDRCSVRNYTLYRKDRPSPNDNKRNVGGGVAIAIRNGIPHNQLPDLGLDIIETIGIEVQGVHVYAAYFPGSKLNSQKLALFKSDIAKIATLRKRFLLGGDFNSKHRLWNCSKRNKAGQILFEEMSKRNFLIHFPDTHTYFPPQANRTTPSTIDIFLSSGLNNVSNIETLNDLSSDHLPVTCRLEFSSKLNIPPPTKRCYSKANWQLYKTYISENLDLLAASTLDSKDKVDDAIKDLSTLIKKAESLSIPLFKRRELHSVLDDEIKSLISLRNRVRRQWQRRGCTDLKKEVNFLNREIKFRVKAHKNESWGAKLSKLKSHSNQLWKVTKIFNNPVKVIPPIKTSSAVLITDLDKANEIGSVFCRAHGTTFNDMSDPNTEMRVSVSYNNVNFFSPVVNEVDLPTPREISKLIRSLKNGKSPGDDSINNALVKQLPKKAVIMIMQIFRACLRLAYFPNSWKCAKVVPIPKPGKDHAQACNYRPISLLNTLSKLLEKVILNRLKSHLSTKNILPNEQFGFRAGHSTNHQLLRVCNYVKEALRRKHSTGMVIFDIEKAFDSVWHKGLIHKLFILKFPLYLVKIIQSFLHKRSFYVSVNSHKSNIFRALAGVPQGSVLSPTLYNVYTSDLKITKSEKAFFADDTGLYVSGMSPGKIVKNLNAASKQLTDYSTKWKIKLNDVKSDAIFFTRRRAEKWLPSTGITVRNAEIAWKDPVKYLGVNLDKTLTFKTHIDRVQNKALKNFGALYPLLNKRSKLNTINKIRVFRAIIQSVLLAACPVWGNCALSHVQKLQVIQNKCLKTILNLPRRHETSDLHRLASIPTITEQIFKITQNLRGKLIHSENPVIRSMH